MEGELGLRQGRDQPPLTASLLFFAWCSPLYTHPLALFTVSFCSGITLASTKPTVVLHSISSALFQKDDNSL